MNNTEKSKADFTVREIYFANISKETASRVSENWLYGKICYDLKHSSVTCKKIAV